MPTNSSGGLGRELRDSSVPEGVKKFAQAGRRGGGSTEATGAGRAPSDRTGKASGRNGTTSPSSLPPRPLCLSPFG